LTRRRRISCLFALPLLFALRALSIAEPRNKPASDDAIAVPSAIYDALMDAKRWEEIYEHDRAIEVVRRLIEADKGKDPVVSAHLYFHWAIALRRTGDVTESLSKVNRAIALNPRRKTYRGFKQELELRRAGIDGKPASARYFAYRDVGSAKRLTATGGVLHIFVEGKNSQPWSEFERLQAHVAIENGSEWLVKEAAARGVKADFLHRYMDVPSSPLFRKIDVPTWLTSEEYRLAWEKALLKTLNAESFGQLFKEQFPGVDLENRSLMFYANMRARPFAMRVSKAHHASGIETAFCHFDVTNIMNPDHAVTYVHELSHLYGADDLYDKVPDPLGPERDVMRVGSYRLEKCLVSDITAYAIGWTNVIPKTTRLQIVTSGPQHIKKGPSHD
jgi:hypothetical protein